MTYEIEDEEGNRTDMTPEGGRHAHVEGRYDLIPPEAMTAIAMVMKEGADRGYEPNNWRKVPLDTQINHALHHLAEHMAGTEDGEDHLSHALTRLAMAVAVRR